MGRSARQHFVDKWIAVRRIRQHLLVGRLEYHVGHHGKELVLFATHHHKLADAQIFNTLATLKACRKPFDQ